MKIKFLNLDKRAITIIKEIGRLAAQRNIPAYVVGGFVRDLILKKKNLDIDIVVEGDAIAFAKVIAKKKKAQLRIYRQFQTATLEYKNGLHVDLATARKERYPRSGALPVVRPGTIHNDLFRRDFTINAMAVVINPTEFGELVDEHGGRKDLRKGKIRVLHEQSFIDDPTRILRAVRFEQRFDFSMERQTLDFLKSALKQEKIKNVKPPRFFTEFRKILKEPHPVKSIRRLNKLKGLGFIKKGFRPRLEFLNRVERNISRISKRSFYRGKGWGVVYLMALTADMRKQDITRMIASFHLTRLEKKVLLSGQETRKVIKYLERKGLAPSQVYQILSPLKEEVVFFLFACTSGNNVSRHIDRFLQKSRFVKLAITGKDLKRLGVPPGQQMGKMLDALLLQRVDAKIPTRSQQVREVKKMRGVYHGAYGKG